MSTITIGVESKVAPTLTVDYLVSNAALPDGGYVSLVGAEGASTTNSYLVRFDAHGVRIGGLTPLPAFAYSTIEELSDGFVVVGSANNGGQSGVFFQRYDVNAVAVGGLVPVSSPLASGPSVIDVVDLTSGRFAVLWREATADPTNPKSYLSLYDAQGAAVGPAVGAPGANRLVDLAALTTGGFVMAYEGAGGRLYVQRYDAAGAVVGVPNQVDGGANYRGNNAPSVTSLPGGGFAVVWTEGFTNSIHARWFNASGVPLSSPVQVSTASGGLQQSPAIAYVGDGKVAVAWADGSPSAKTVAGQMFDLAGAKIGGPIDYTKSVGDFGVNITALASGDYVVTSLNFSDPFQTWQTFVPLASLPPGGGGVTLYSGPDYDLVFGGPGSDTVSYAYASAAVQVSLTINREDYLEKIENITGSAYNDVLSGNAGDNLLDGGAGVDLASYASAPSGVQVSLGISGAQATGWGSDAFVSIESLVGSYYNDVLTGDGGANVLRGGEGLDQVFGGGGDDVIQVRASEAPTGETADGGAGTDTLETVGDIVFTRGFIAGFEKLSLGFEQYTTAGPTVGFTAAQAASGFSSSLAVVGSARTDTIQITAHSGAVVDISGWTFANWSPTDIVQVFVSTVSDLLTVNLSASAMDIALDSGSDTLALKLNGPAQATTVRDFKAAPIALGGDQLDLTGVIATLVNYTPGANPFATGHLRLLQNFSQTLLQIDADGGGDNFSTLLTLWNVDPFDLSPANLGGFVAAPAPLATQIGGFGPDILDGRTVHDLLVGGAGDDQMYGHSGGDRLDGGDGYDTALYFAPRRAYATTLSAGVGTVFGGPEGGGDTLIDVERLKFSDGHLNTGVGDTSAQVYRIYVAALGRAPDDSGLANWVQAIGKRGASLQAVADGFIGSEEFLTRYGASTDNNAFVALLYANVLHRAPDDSGRKDWLDFLTIGGGSRAQAVIGFSESAENVSNTTPAIQQGIWVGDPNAGVVARLYDTVFGRLPDASGLDNWTRSLNAGTTPTQVAAGFVNAPEFQTTYGSLDNAGFVELMYGNVLHRHSDPGGLSRWLGVLASGHSRAEVVVGFSESPEHIQLLAPHIDAGAWFA